MSRSVRDLRELICTSRLSYRNENDNGELCLSDTSSDDVEDGDISSRGNVSPPKLPKRKKDLDPLRKNGKPLSPSTSSGSSGGSCSPLPLPPIRQGSKSSLSYGSEKEKYFNGNKAVRNDNKSKGNFDWMLGFADPSVINEWLVRANEKVKDLTTWLHADSNFVQFAHFWLSTIPKDQRRELVEVEISIVIDELCFAFGPGLKDNIVKQEDITSFLSAIFWEFPSKFSDSECGSFFLYVVICLCSIKRDSYKSLLSNVKCGTENKQYAQFILAARAFAIINLCVGVLGFYQKICPSKGLDSRIPSRDMMQVATEFAFDAICKGFVDVVKYLLSSFIVDPHNAKRKNGKSLLFAAVVSGQKEVVRHLLQIEPKLDVNEVSSSGNSLLHAGVNSGNKDVVEMLMKAGANLNMWNGECDGATPLHMAVMSGSVLLKAWEVGYTKWERRYTRSGYEVIKCRMLKYLERSGDIPRIILNFQVGENRYSRWGTSVQFTGVPALRNTLTGNCEMVSLMVQAGCDQSVLMGVPATVTPLKLAQDLGLEEIVELLSKSSLNCSGKMS